MPWMIIASVRKHTHKADGTTRESIVVGGGMESRLCIIRSISPVKSEGWHSGAPSRIVSRHVHTSCLLLPVFVVVDCRIFFFFVTKKKEKTKTKQKSNS